MKLFAKIVNGLKPLSILAKSSILDVLWGLNRYLAIQCSLDEALFCKNSNLRNSEVR